MEESKKFKRAKVFMDKIPEGWNVYSLDELLDLIRNGTSQKQNLEKVGLAVTRIETIANRKVNYEKVGFVDTSEDLEGYRMFPGDILFSNINSIKHIAKVALYNGEKPLYHGMNLLLLRSNSKVYSKYLYYLLSSYPVKKYYESNAKQAVNQASLNQSDVQSLTLVYPPLIEQQKIASILSSVDKAIEKTEQILDQTNIVKKGLIYQIFTKGIDSTNSRKTKVGEVPAYWRLHSLSDIADVIDPQPDHRAPKEDQNGLPYVGVGDVNIDGTLNFKKARKITVEAVTKQENSFTIEKGDIAFGKVGTLGKPRFLPTDVRYALSATMVLIKPQDIDYKFLYYALQSPILAQQIHMQTTGGTRPTIGILKLRQFVIPIPTREEQYRVATSLDNVEDKIKIERKKLSFLKNIKKGLMQQLLTGKVRVPMSENEEVRQ